MSFTRRIVFLPPIFRFLMELTAWTYFLILAFTVDIIFILGFILSVILLGLFNFPGDKKQNGPINVPGWMRILNEWFSGGLLSIIGAFLLFQEVGAVMQFVLLLIVIIFDKDRYAWMLGLRETAPEYVTILRQVNRV
ncbi:MAG: hypothetical protein ACFFD1_12955 [Candidatus Thorarchaeota archaeon]